MAARESVGGINAVASALEHEHAGVHELLVQADVRNARVNALAREAGRRGIPVRHVDADALVRATGLLRHQGVAMVRDAPRTASYDERALPGLLAAQAQPLLLVLDGVQDPHNLGACLRSAAAASVTAVIAPRDKAAGITPAVRKVAAGAAERVPFVQVTNLARTLRQLREAGVWIVGLAGEGERSVYELDLTGPLAIVLGGEGEGLRRLTREHCDFLARIPIDAAVESLNVSVATGVALFEARRQRG
ncbi:MAG TPA: 23S rRNA (guanosine(2251)-2'-O)-methyltransferase RlmB [Xanthomonadaceae bacterium]|nr:23S rRNA (guanosine(2251)-2'-O)-methyltransferase RlmB [Xanthomonadaceae bacterium]